MKFGPHEILAIQYILQIVVDGHRKALKCKTLGAELAMHTIGVHFV